MACKLHLTAAARICGRPGRAAAAATALLMSAGVAAAAAAADLPRAAADGCAMSAQAPRPARSGSAVWLQVRPSAAGACQSQADEPSQVYVDPTAAAKGVLAVFLPGTGGLPAQFPAFLRRGAARGYHVIGLRYPNAESVNRLCRAAPGDADCAGAVREEVFTGRDSSPWVRVAPAESIEQRLGALLRYLARHRPEDGWAQFLDTGSALRWDRVSMHGNSQGAGHAVYIAKLRPLARVGLYAGPSDWVFEGHRAPHWYRLPSRTPAAAHFGLVHEPDTIANASGDPAQVVTVWGEAGFFGLRGPLLDVGTTPGPYGGTQRLLTRACAGRGPVIEHNCPMFSGHQRAWDAVSFP